MQKVKPSELKAILRATFAAHLPTWVEGAPGIGKTKIHEQVAEELSMQFFPPLYLAMLDTVDLGGMNMPYIMPDGHRKLERLLDDWLEPVFSSKSPGVLLIDEATKGSLAVQSAAGPLLDARRVGRHKLPDYITICAAGNRRKDRSGDNNILTHITSRLTSVELVSCPIDWTARALVDKVHPWVISHIKASPSSLHQFDAEKSYSANSAYPAPRAWYKVGSLLEANVPQNLWLAVFEGTVGEAQARLFIAHCDLVQQEVDVLHILQGGKWKFPSKEKLGARYAFAIGLGACVQKDTIDRIVDIAKELADKGETEYGEVIVQTAIEAWSGTVTSNAWRNLQLHKLGQAFRSTVRV